MIQIHPVFHIQKYIFTVRQPFYVQIQQDIHQPACIDTGSHIADAVSTFKNRMVHGKNHAPRTRRFHNSQIRQLRLCQYGILKYFQRISRPGRHADRIFRGMRQNVCFRSRNIQPLKNTFDRGKILGIRLNFLQKLRVFRIRKQIMHLTPQSKSCDIFFRRSHIIVDNRCSGLHCICHLIGNVIFDRRSSAAGHNKPQQKHPCYGKRCCNNTNPRRKLLIH